MSNDLGRSPDGDGLSSTTEPVSAVSALRASIPSAGDGFTIAYPFIRDFYTAIDEEGSYDAPTWKPGVRFEPPYSPTDPRSRMLTILNEKVVKLKNEVERLKSRLPEQA